MKITLNLLDKLTELSEGKYLPASSIPKPLLCKLMDEGCLVKRVHGSRLSVRAKDKDSLYLFLKQELGIDDLQQQKQLCVESDLTRSQLVTITGDSKAANIRGWAGFPVAVLAPIRAVYNDTDFMLLPTPGISTIIHNFHRFTIPEDVVVVGIENGENFRYLAAQTDFFCKYLDINKAVFVSRYPQSGDIARWLAGNSNSYIHFGDLDLAGIDIYQNEYFKKLGDRAQFLIPDDFDERISKGSYKRYTQQFEKLKDRKILDDRVQPVVDSIHKHHKGYDQEGFIMNPSI